MKFTKLTQKLKSTALSIFIAIAMILSANFSSFSTIANYARYTSSVANAVYSAKNDRSFTFASSDSLTTTAYGNSSNYDIDRDADIVDAFSHVDNKKYFPIVKYNGFSALSEEREDLTADQRKADKADTFYGVISTNNYQVARKDYKKDDSSYIFETTKLVEIQNEGTADEKQETNEVNVIYVSASKKTGENDEQFAERVAALKNILKDINDSKNIKTNEADLYVYLDTNTTTNPDYDSSDYSSINSDTEVYKEIGEDLEGKQIGGQDIEQSSYRFYNKKTYEYVENVLAIKTNNTITLTNNSYYVVSVWVYTAGNASATIAVTGTNLSAKIADISTNGLWVQYYLFIATPAQDSTNVTVSLYYGDENGVTGTQSFQSFKDTNNESYKANTLTGTVGFDQLKIDAINQEEYINQTINGYSYLDIAKANLADEYKSDITKIENNKEATASETEVEGKKVTTYSYNKTTFASNDLNHLAKSASFSARHTNPSFAGFDASFQTLNGKTNSDLVYNYNNSEELDYNTYLLNGTKMFSYYMPRYTADDNTTPLTTSAKDSYRDRYQNNNLVASVVAENTEFDAYEKDKVDEFGQKIETSTDGEDEEYEKLENLHNNTFINNPGETNYILKLENTSSYDLGLTSTPIYMPTHGYYRVSVWAYSENEEAIATAKLFATMQERTTAQNGTLVLASATATDFEYNSNSFNGWKELVFAVQGNPYQSAQLYLSLLASDNDTVYFDNITVENITSSQYTATDHKINLADVAVLTSKVTNGLFNNITVSSTDPITSYPYAASSWTIDTKQSSDSVVSGVISTNKEVFENKIVPAYNDKGELDYYDQNYVVFNNGSYYYTKDGSLRLEFSGANQNALIDYKGDFVRATTLSKMFDTNTVPVTTINDILQAEGLPGYTTNYNLPDSNVYAVYLPEPTAQAGEETTNPSFIMKSSSISSLSSNSVYKLTFQAWLADNFEGKLVARLVYDSKNISDIELDTSSLTITRNTWQTFTIYIRTGNTSRSGISLHLGAVESTGTVFFQNVNHTTLAEKTDGANKISVDEQFDKLLADNSTLALQNTIVNGKVEYVRFVDMHSNNFTMHSTKQDDKTYLYESYNYKLNEKGSSDKYTQGTVAVIDTENFPASFKFNGTDVDVEKHPNATTNTALLLKNEDTTDYTVANSTFSTTLSSKKYYKLTFYVLTSAMGDNGLTVTTTSKEINDKFENISTTAQDNNGWEEYTIYISVGSSSISSFSLKFALGTSDNNSFTGWALVSSINLTEIEEDVYNEDTEKTEIKDNDNVIIKQLKTDDSDSDEDDKEDEDKFNWATFFLVFSSILLVVALAIALITVISKKKAKKNTPDAAAAGGIESSEKETGGIE